MQPDPSREVFRYHQRSKHSFQAYAPGPGGLDWASQPDPFRRYAGTLLLPLEQVPPAAEPDYEAALAGTVPPAPLNFRSVSQLFFDSLALSAWKQAGETRWALRVNPSSGNLHPTEGYLVCGEVPGLCEEPLVAHYAPREHALEVRARFAPETWRRLCARLPAGTVLVGLTSVQWREAWKYGHRAFRYCQHDVGHAVAAVSVAAAGLGWRAALLDLSSESLADLLGTRSLGDAEPEEPECLLAVYPAGAEPAERTLPPDALREVRALRWQGVPNVLSTSHRDWGLEPVTRAARVPAAGLLPIGERRLVPVTAPSPPSGAGLRRLIHQRRSAVAMDGRTGLTAGGFYDALRRTLPGATALSALPWEPQVHLLLFVHRVRDVDPGLYLLVRDPAELAPLRGGLRPDFEWKRPAGCPEELSLYRLVTADARQAAARLSCFQDIAADGCFSLAMLARFEEPLRRYGPWWYPRLFWECGAIGQALYLEAEALGIRATGIGCFFDDPTHELLGLEGSAYQDLYHFTVGGPVEDRRLTTLPAYPG